MMNIPIENMRNGLVTGVSVMLPQDETTYRESFFEWKASALSAEFQTNRITGGVLKAWHHTPTFHEIETHADKEMFYFISGTAIMLFVDVEDGKPSMDTARITRIQAGTQIIIDAGKGHFVAVAENDEPVCAVVVAPQMGAPRLPLKEVVSGV